MLIITLSSIPPRFSRIGPTLRSLQAQARKPDRILLYIPQGYRRFPDWDGTLPEVPEGVEIRRVADDLGPATKVLHAAREFHDHDIDLLFCDDDRVYPPDWAESFLAARQEHPGCCIAQRGLMADRIAGTSPKRDLQPRATPRPFNEDWEFKLKHLWRRLRAGSEWRAVRPPERRLFRTSGYIDMFEGCSGVLVKPAFFDDEAFDIPPVAWSVDDVWLSGMLAKKGIPIWLVANRLTPENTEAQAYDPLASAVIGGATRHEANLQAVRYMQETFGMWL